MNEIDSVLHRLHVAIEQYLGTNMGNLLIETRNMIITLRKDTDGRSN